MTKCVVSRFLGHQPERAVTRVIEYVTVLEHATTLPDCVGIHEEPAHEVKRRRGWICARAAPSLRANPKVPPTQLHPLAKPQI